MRAFTQLTALCAAILRDNIDTDAIIPSREITSVSKTGLASGLFAGWRYLPGEGRRPNPDFELNRSAARGAQILLAGENFGCGSSREHAVWALMEYGFRAVVAPSFNPIFFRNCVRNGLLPCSAAVAQIARIVAAIAADPAAHPVTIDLAAQRLRVDDIELSFAIEADARIALLSGADPIDQTLALKAQIDAFRAAHRRIHPWAYGQN